MRQRVVWIKVLIRFEIALGPLVQPLPTQFQGTVRAVHRAAENHLCPIRGDDFFPLDTDVGRDAQFDRIAQHRPDHGQGDAGIPGGGIENDLVRGQRSVFDSFLDHAQRRTIFDRAARIETFEFGIDPDAGRNIRAQPGDFKQRRIPNQMKNGRNTQGTCRRWPLGRKKSRRVRHLCSIQNPRQ